jgi:Flp pilus assembly protein TadD
MSPVGSVLAVVGGLAYQQAASSHPPEQKLLREAIELHQKGDLPGAIRDYEAYLKIRPNAADALSNLGAALAKLGRYEEAIAEYKKALAIDSRNPGVVMNLGLAYYKTGLFKEAVEQWSIARASQPANKQITMLLADAELRLGNNERVIELLRPVEKAGPEDLAVDYMLGTALIRDKQPIGGRALVDRILKNGDSAEARMLLGATKLQVGDFASAREDLQRATELNPALPSVFSAYGTALMSTGDTVGAAAAFKKELETNPNDFIAHLDLGVLVKQDQQYDQAMAHFRRALELRPNDIGVRYQIATVSLLTGDVTAAQRNLESIVKESPQFSEAHVSLATVYYRLKRKEDGDRERAIVQRLTAEAQAREPGAQPRSGNPPQP